MSQKIKILFSIFIFLFSVLPITTAKADAPNLVITEIQVGIEDSKKEFIELFNQSESTIDVSGWTVEYLTDNFNGNIDSAPTRNIAVLEGVVAPGYFILLKNPDYVGLRVLDSANNFLSTGSVLAKTSGYVRVVAVNSGIRSLSDCVRWGGSEATTLAGCTRVSSSNNNDNSSLQREYVNGVFEGILDVTPITPGSVQNLTTIPDPVDVCLATPEIDVEIPEGYELVGGECVLVVVPPEIICSGVELSEILPNPAGDDTNKEFIELYNPTASQLPLDGCSIKVGSATKTLTGFLQPGYTAFYGLTLPNAAGGEVHLLTSTTETVITYPADLADDQSWSRIDGQWQITNIATPNAENQQSAVVETLAGKGVDEEVPCLPGKYRNPETGRCKNIESDSPLAPCDVGEYRNEETNRCRSLATATSSLSACAPDEYRNAETNRCRKLSTASTSPTPCQEGYERNAATNRCRKVAGVSTTNPLSEAASAVAKPVSYPVIAIVAALTLAYGAFEYRQDVANWIYKLKIKKKSV